MRKTQNKLRSEHGATVIMALFFLLIAMMVSVVIVQAAGSASRIIYSDKQQQQAYLAVTSAAQYMVSEIAGASITLDENYQDVSDAGSSSAFKPLLINGIRNNGTLDPPTFYLMIPSETEIPPVEVNLNMTDYDIEAELCLAQESDSGEYPECNYYISLTIDGDKEDSDQNDSQNTNLRSSSSLNRGTDQTVAYNLSCVSFPCTSQFTIKSTSFSSDFSQLNVQPRNRDNGNNNGGQGKGDDKKDNQGKDDGTDNQGKDDKKDDHGKTQDERPWWWPWWWPWPYDPEDPDPVDPDPEDPDPEDPDPYDPDDPTTPEGEITVTWSDTKWEIKKKSTGG